MTMFSNGRHGMTRRAAITRTALAIGAATASAAVRKAEAQQKITQAAAKYQGTPNGSNHCGICSSFQPPDACAFVQSPISQNGWCQLFTAKS